MTDIRSRLADALRESLAPWITGFCSEAEIDVDEDYLLSLIDELSDEITGELLSLPGIAIVPSDAITDLLNSLDRDHKNCLEDAADDDGTDEGAFYYGQAEGYWIVAERIRAQLAAAAQAQEEQ